jgi:hypothetical protein
MQGLARFLPEVCHDAMQQAELGQRQVLIPTAPFDGVVGEPIKAFAVGLQSYLNERA